MFLTHTLMDSPTAIAPFLTALSCCETGLCQVLQGTTAVENSALCSAICSALLATNTEEEEEALVYVCNPALFLLGLVVCVMGLLSFNGRTLKTCYR